MADEAKSSSRNSCALPTGTRVRNMTAARNVLTWRRAAATNAALFISTAPVPRLHRRYWQYQRWPSHKAVLPMLPESALRALHQFPLPAAFQDREAAQLSKRVKLSRVLVHPSDD